MTYTLNIIIFSFLLGLIICLLICTNRIDKLKERVETLESDLDKLENICTSFITENDLDDFCESLYINIQGVGDKIKRGIQDEIDSK